MKYLAALKELRNSINQEPEEDSILKPRNPQPTSADLLTISQDWIKTIKESAKSVKQTKPKNRSGESFVSALNSTLDTPLEKVEEVEEKDVSENGLIPRKFVEKTDNVTSPGYGEISSDQIESVIKAEAAARGIDPSVAVAIFRAEGRGNYQSQVARNGKGSYDGKEDSYGPYQLYRGGGLGNEYEKQTGRDLRADNTVDGVTNQVRFALDKAVELGWTPWYGRGPAGVGVRDGLKGAKKLGNWK